MGVGSPRRIIDALVARGARGLTVIANDTARPGVGIGKPIGAGCVSRLVVSHIGTNPETQARMISGELAFELVPQRTLAERIRPPAPDSAASSPRPGSAPLRPRASRRCGSATGTILLETALGADVALVAARSADHLGNLVYSLTARNFNPLMAMAATRRAAAAEMVPSSITVRKVSMAASEYRIDAG